MQPTFTPIVLSMFLTVLLFVQKANSQFVKIPLKPLISNVQTTDLLVAVVEADSSQTAQLIPTQNIQGLVRNSSDISLLNPSNDKTWSLPIHSVTHQVDDISLITINNPVFIKTGPQKFDFTASINGLSKNFVTSRTFRNQLLLAGLLSHLGYAVPKMDYVKQAKMSFTSAEEKKKFKENLARKLIGSSDWIVTESETELTLRDLIMYDPLRTDLTRDYILQGMISNQRKFEALLVPWTLVNINESLNKEPWYCVQVNDEVAYLFNQNAKEFNTNIFDLRWMARLIKKQITDDAVKSIVANAHFPAGISGLIEQIFKSRINSVTKTFLNEVIYNDVNFNYSFGDYIEKSQINRDKMLNALSEKTVTRFASEDEVILIDKDGLKKLGIDIITSNIVANMLDMAHDATGIKTDISFNIMQQLVNKMDRDLEDFANTGKIKTEPVTLKSIPYVDARFAYSSDLVLGNYGGTKNLVQRVDVFGYFVNGGVLKDFTKFVHPGEYLANGKRAFNINLGYQKFYARVKPIYSLKEKQQPDDSSFIPLWVEKLFGDTTETTAVANSADQTPQPAKPQLTVAERVKKFTNDFRVGESFILTETTAGQESVKYTLPLNRTLTLFARLFADQKVINRIHIHRISETQLQVYKDKSKVGLGDQWGWDFGIEALIPAFSISKLKSTPEVNTIVYMLDLNHPPEKLWPALKHLFMDFSIEDVKTLATRFKITHDMDIRTLDLNVLWHNSEVTRISDDFTIHVNENIKKNVYYNAKLTKAGNNFPKFAAESINGFIKKKNPYAHYLINVNSNLFSEASFLNTSQIKEVSYEHDLNKDNSIFDQSINIKYTFKTPFISRDDLVKTIQDLNQKFEFEFFDINRFATTEKVLILNFLTQFTINQPGIFKLLTLTEKELMNLSGKIFNAENCPNFVQKSGESEESCEAAIHREKTMLVHMYNKIRSHAYILSNFVVAKEQAPRIVELVDYLEHRANFKELIQFFGGTDNVYVQVVISGFRKGDETALAQKDLYSRTLGRVHKYPNGPLKYYSENLNLMTESYSVLSSEILGDWAK